MTNPCPNKNDMFVACHCQECRNEREKTVKAAPLCRCGDPLSSHLIAGAHLVGCNRRGCKCHDYYPEGGK